MDQGPKSYWAEFLGTFTLCLIGQGAIGVQSLVGAGPDGLLPIAVASGLAYALMISALGATSGGHFNPAVTFGFVVTGRQSWTSAITYWISQLLGALAASFLLRSVLPGEPGQATHWGVLRRHRTWPWVRRTRCAVVSQAGSSRSSGRIVSCTLR